MPKIALALLVFLASSAVTACGGDESAPANESGQGSQTAPSGQRVSIQMLLKQERFPNWEGTFVLTGLTPGKIERDEGDVDSPGGMASEGIRNGQSYTRDRGMDKLSSAAGTLDISWDQTIVSAGLEFSVATGTWKAVRGTGAYEGVTGGGRLAGVIGEETHIGHVRYEGFLNVP